MAGSRRRRKELKFKMYRVGTSFGEAVVVEEPARVRLAAEVLTQNLLSCKRMMSIKVPAGASVVTESMS